MGLYPTFEMLWEKDVKEKLTSATKYTECLEEA